MPGGLGELRQQNALEAAAGYAFGGLRNWLSDPLGGLNPEDLHEGFSEEAHPIASFGFGARLPTFALAEVRWVAAIHLGRPCRLRMLRRRQINGEYSSHLGVSFPLGDWGLRGRQDQFGQAELLLPVALLRRGNCCFCSLPLDA
jgi:hypothetical protein